MLLLFPNCFYQQLAAQDGCVRLSWAVLGWNKDARRLYDRIGATDNTEAEGWHMLTMRKDKFKEFAKSGTSKDNICYV